MNKSQLIKAVAERTGESEACTAATINTALEIITERLSRREPVEITGFGKFDLMAKPAYKGRHPVTKEMIDIPAGAQPYFKVGKKLKDAVK